jgi:hypothetical protein
MYAVDLWSGDCLTAEEVLIRGFKCARTVPLTVAFISVFSVFEVILEGMKPRGCANHKYTLTLTWGAGLAYQKADLWRRRSLRWTSIVQLHHSFVRNAWLECENCAFVNVNCGVLMLTGWASAVGLNFSY